MNILHLDSGLFAGQSLSRALAAKLVQRLQAVHPGSTLVYRDLAQQAPAHLDATILLASGKAEAERSASEQEQVRLTQTLLDELVAADVIVIGAPMYNFGMPSTLKAWFDHVLRAGITFRYSEAGPEGLLKGKRAIVVESRGGLYSEGPAQAMDSQEPHLRTLLRFMGITDVEFVRAEKLGFGPEAREHAIVAARAELDRIVREARVAA